MKEILLALICILLADIAFQLASVSNEVIGHEYSIFSIEDVKE